jgi:hypothetical protein
MQNNRKPHNPGKIYRPGADAPRGHRTGKANFGPRILGWMMLAACAAVGAGCTGGGGSLNGTDPLVGEIHPPKPGAYGPVPNGPSAAPPKVGAVDPLLGPNTTPPASMALAPTGNSRPTLQINDNVATSGNNTAFTSGYRTTSGNASAVTPLADAQGQPAGSYAHGTPTSEMLQQQLRARGVVWQKLETLPDGRVCFTCVVPNRYNPESPREIDATARDYVTAIQAALVKIDQP